MYLSYVYRPLLLWYSPLLHFILCCFQLCSTSFPPSLIVSTLPASEGQPSLHVFNNQSTGQAERGKTFYIFNVVQPTEANSIFSTDDRNIATTNQWEFYIINSVEVSDAGILVVQYFVWVNTNAENLGTLTTNITVIGEPKHLNGIVHVALLDRMLAVYTGQD